MKRKLLSAARTAIRLFMLRSERRFALAVAAILNGEKLTILDIGAAGGLEPRWNRFAEHLKVVSIEPHQKSNAILQNKSHQVSNIVAWSTETELIFYNCQKATVSSVMRPNRFFVDRFPKSSRFDIVKEQRVNASTVDKLLGNDKRVQFIKLDIQGAELEVLKGSAGVLHHALGLEVEVEFKEMYEGQPLFCDIRQHLESLGFTFMDFLSIYRWQRDCHDHFGEIVFSDALFLKAPEEVSKDADALTPNGRMLLLRRYIFILAVFGRRDWIGQCAYLFPVKERQEVSTLVRNLDRRLRKLGQAQKLTQLVFSAILPDAKSHVFY